MLERLQSVRRQVRDALRHPAFRLGFAALILSVLIISASLQFFETKDILSGLAVESVGVIVELLLVYVVVEAILKKRDEREWAFVEVDVAEKMLSASILLAKYFVELYGLYCRNQGRDFRIIVPLSVEEAHSRFEEFDRARQALRSSIERYSIRIRSHIFGKLTEIEDRTYQFAEYELDSVADRLTPTTVDHGFYMQLGNAMSFIGVVSGFMERRFNLDWNEIKNYMRRAARQDRWRSSHLGLTWRVKAEDISRELAKLPFALSQDIKELALYDFIIEECAREMDWEFRQEGFELQDPRLHQNPYGGEGQ